MKKPRCILLDIEGTTSSVSFVYDVMFPYVREHLAAFLEQNWDSDGVRACLPLLASETDQNSVAWLDGDAKRAQNRVIEAVTRLMDGDVKATGLKQLQGLIWKNGFESGQMVAHVYDDVEPAIKRWHADGIEIRIYSSGSVAAQKLFFGHCLAGNLLELFAAHYDTTTGPKKESASYTAIAEDAGWSPAEILFISDVVAELDAAEKAGMQTRLSVRLGNKLATNHGHLAIREFGEIEFQVSV